MSATKTSAETEGSASTRSAPSTVTARRVTRDRSATIGHPLIREMTLRYGINIVYVNLQESSQV